MDKNGAFKSQYILENTMCASYLEKMWRIQTTGKPKECVHGAKSTIAVSARKYCFDNWWRSIHIKAFSQGNAATSNNWRAEAKATHWIPPGVQLRVHRFLSHPHLQWGPRVTSKGRFCWVLLYIWNWICPVFHMTITSEISALQCSQGRACGGSKHCWGQSPSSTRLPEQSQCSHIHRALGPVRSCLSEGALGAAGTRHWRTGSISPCLAFTLGT